MSYNYISNINFTKSDKVLEPSFGDGSSIILLIDRFIPLYNGSILDVIDYILNYNIYGYEIDECLFNECLNKINQKWGCLPSSHNLKCQDFLTSDIKSEFDYIIGCPPIDGFINPLYSNDLSYLFGRRDKFKIKRDTYSYYVVKCVEILSEDGQLIFTISESFTHSKSMEGLRRWLISKGFVEIHIGNLLKFNINDIRDYILFNNNKIMMSILNSTPKFRWCDTITDISREVIGSYVHLERGLNPSEFFIKDIINNSITEKYLFSYYDELITLQSELEKSKSGILPKNIIKEIKRKEDRCETRINVLIEDTIPYIINIPDDRYRYYNIDSNEILWTLPSKVIYWDDNGEFVKTYLINNNLYYPKFENMDCLTLCINDGIKARYLTSNYINGSQYSLYLKDGVNCDELYFLLGWLISDKCNNMVKSLKIQLKNIEKIPYPTWVSDYDKKSIINFIKSQIKLKQNEYVIDDDYISEVSRIFEKE